jgi:hypothetical protein
VPLFQAKFDKSPRRIAKLQEIPNVSLDATTAGAKTKPAAVGESRNKYSWAGIVLVRVELLVRSATGVIYRPNVRSHSNRASNRSRRRSDGAPIFGGHLRALWRLGALAAYSLTQFGHLLIILA